MGECHTLEHGANCSVLIEHAAAGTGGLLTRGGLGYRQSQYQQASEQEKYVRSGW